MSERAIADPDVEALIREVMRPGLTDGAIWSALVDTGLARMATPEDIGGGGSALPAVLALLDAAGHAGSSVPLAEHDLLAGRLLRRSVDDRLRTVAHVDAGGSAQGVPLVDEVEILVALRRGPQGLVEITEVPIALCTVSDLQSVAGERRPTLVIPDGWDSWLAETTPDLLHAVHLLTAWSRCAKVVGAMERVLELCVEHTTTRSQFGRPIARFQAVQVLVADVATSLAVSRASTEAAMLRLAGADGPALAAAALDAEFEIAAACSVVGHAASVVVRNAHQVHGALGTTSEHALQRHTRQILGWRSECGSIRDWDRVVHRLTVAAGGNWQRIAPAVPY